MIKLKDIAQEAGVSSALVSYYLNGNKAGRMSDVTRARIKAAIKKLDYKPNRMARFLRTGKSRNIGMLVGNISNSYWGHIAEEALIEARNHDYSLILALTGIGNSDRKSAIEFLMRNQVAALFSSLPLHDLRSKKELKGHDMPMLRLGFPEEGALCLLDDVQKALEDACKYLQSRGHDSMFGFLDASFSWNKPLDNAAKNTGISLVHQSYRSAVERDAIYQYIAENRPSAILLNGLTLYDVLKLVHNINDYAPDIIIGSDEFHTFMESPLIVGGIQTSTAEKARRGVQLLIGRLENPDNSREELILMSPGKFVRL